jgi:hypothetical protein
MSLGEIPPGGTANGLDGEREPITPPIPPPPPPSEKSADGLLVDVVEEEEGIGGLWMMKRGELAEDGDMMYGG